MGILDRVRAKQAERKEASERREAEKVVRDAALAEEREQAEEAARRARVLEILGRDLAEMDVNTPDEAKIAIKLARLRKKEIQTEKRELAAELADVREQWRDRQAGRISTVGLGRGTSGRMVRAGIQSKRRNERMGHAQQVNQFSDARQELDSRIAYIDRLIVDLERQALKR